MKASYCKSFLRNANCSSTTRRFHRCIASSSTGTTNGSGRRLQWPLYIHIPNQHVHHSIKIGDRMSLFSSTPSYASPSHVTSSPSKSFKKVIRPFLRACHPDAMMGASTEQTADDIAPSTTHHGKRTVN